ncbi:aldo/keto reductase, partial [Micromonospora musae]|uniref:aldo/keto reductase n=1 Tax=Micromonospora musae TaxID=1894970 RepID=UPI00340F0B43
RVDPAVPVEETFGALGELIAEGKIGHAGISEASAQTIRRAYAAGPLSAVEMEYSLSSRDVEQNGVLATVRELSIGFLAYAPLGRGLLSGTVRSSGQVAHDLRGGFPRFSAENLEHNVKLVDALAAVAAPLGLTVGQLALSWLLTAAPEVVAVPGTRHSAHLAQNVAASGFRLDPETRRAVEAALPAAAVAGRRTSPADIDIEEP